MEALHVLYEVAKTGLKVAETIPLVSTIHQAHPSCSLTQPAPWYLSLSLWFIMLSMIISRSIHVAANGTISFIFMAK